MKLLTTGDLDFLRLLWSRVRVRRAELASADQRAGDRLAAVGIVQRFDIVESQVGRGYLAGGNGWSIVFEFDPIEAERSGDPDLLDQLRQAAPDLLVPRPIGPDAQSLFKIVK